MAVPTTTVTTEPNYVLDVTGTNIDAGNNDYLIAHSQAAFTRGFSIVTGTLTNMTVTVLGYNKDGVAKDMTNDLFKVSALSSDTVYGANVMIPLKGVIVRVARSNATNAVALTFFAPRR